MRSVFASLLGVLVALPVCAGDPPPLSPEPKDRTADEAMKPAAQRFKDLIPGLIEALKDADPDVRQHASLALAAVGTDALKPLAEALKDVNKERRAAAAYAIGQMGFAGRDALSDLLTALKDDDANVRRASAQAISRIVTSESRSINSMVTGRGRADVFGPAPLSLPTRGAFPTVPEPTPTPDKDKPEKAK